MKPINLRLADFDDAPQITALTKQLGYQSTEEDMACRLAELNQQANDAIFVAESETDGVVGWIHLHVHRDLLNNPVVLINGLVVDKAHRGQGIGSEMLEQAELWGQAHGCEAIYVKSNIIRERAHRFYEKHGYRHIKTQYAFLKTL